MMLEDQKLREIRKRVQGYIAEETIKTKNPPAYVDFFLKNAEDSLNSAQCLYDISTNKRFQEQTGYIGLNGFLWVINASYYSMFYNVRALMERSGIRIRSDLSIHARTFDVFVHFFYLTGKLQKELFRQYAEASEEAAELLGKQKADELVMGYFYEKGKRAALTYQTGQIALQSKAKTSLERAQQFNREMRKLLK